MDRVIEKLIHIENRAQSVVSSAKQFRDDIDNIVETNINEIRKNIDEHKAAKLQAIMQVEKEAADERIKELEKRIGAAEDKMQQTYRQNADQWVDEIFGEIINT